VTFGNDACFLISFCNLLSILGVAELDPLEFNKKAYKSGCMANAAYWASLYNLTYLKTTSKPLKVCIAETNYWKAVAPQHFFVLRPDGMIIDPLDLKPVWKKNTRYGIVSYRIFTPPMTPEPTQEPPKPTQIDPSQPISQPDGTVTTPEPIEPPTAPILTPEVPPKDKQYYEQPSIQGQQAVDDLVSLIFNSNLWNRLLNFFKPKK
jgi:hypothetical protein